jgi:hypothetical protein
MRGFETIGNATLIVHDGEPLLATDPWIAGEPYFGSWGMSHQIPPEILDRIKRSRFIWFSHGHPDHLNADSLDLVSDRQILLPDHVGGRIAGPMIESKLNVRILPTKQWVELSPNVRVMCLPDYNQDATLLVAMGDRLIVDLNDGGALGYRLFIRRLSRAFKRRYLLALRNYGDADMMNLWDDKGRFLPPPAANKPSVGRMYEELLRSFSGTHAVPFSCFHAYQRSDSVWASRYSTPLAAHYQGYGYRGADLLPAFVRVDFERDSVTELNPPQAPAIVKDPAAFGDDWSESLEKDELTACAAYFKRKAHLSQTLGFVNLRIGGRTDTVVLNPALKTGLTFECPRNSFVKAIKWEIFDDLLIGNFMKTTLHGLNGLYPDFTPYVAKYADNGRAQSEEELRSYFKAYRERSTAEFLLTRLHFRADAAFRRQFSRESGIFRAAKRVYHWIK